MENPFDVIDSRLNTLEELLIELKHTTLPRLLGDVKVGQENQYVTKKEAAKLLSCSTATIDNWRRSGKLKRYNLGKSVRFKREDVLQLL